MSRVLIDAGPLYALVDPSDGFHSRARNELDLLHKRQAKILAASPIVMEAYSLTLHRLGLTVASRWLRSVSETAAVLNPAGSDISAAIQRIAGFPDQAITLFDSVLAELSDRLQIPVWTFDHHFEVMQVRVWRSAMTSSS